MSLTYSNYGMLKKGDQAPEFGLPGVDGRKHSLKNYGGKKAYLVVFMCNHCPYVKPKMTYLKALQDKYAGQGLQVFGISSNDTKSYAEDDFENMKKVSEKHKFMFPYLIDESQATAKAYGAACTPDPFLFNSEKKLVYHGRIDDAHGKMHDDASTNELEEAVQQALKGEKVTVKEEPSLGCNVKWKSN